MPFDNALTTGLVGLPENDRRLAHELAAGVLRQRDALDAVLLPAVHRGLDSLEPTAHDILRLAVYQIGHLDRVPRHAAVATAVSLAREAIGERITGFINAVLRKVTALPEDQLRPVPADVDPAVRLAAEHSHPEWLVRRWLERWGPGDTARLLEWNNGQPPLAVQPARLDIDQLAESFTAAGVRFHPAPYGAGLVLEETRPELLPGFADGAFLVQDPAQALVVRFADFPARSVVYDAAAAPGGKTLALARHAAVVIAGDAARPRLPRLRENIVRAGTGPIHVVLADALHPPVARVDAVLLDAPCLGTGTFARHPDARLRVKPEALARLAREQAQLLDAVADRVRPGGVLCYATCSLEPEEDEDQVDAFLTRNPTFSRVPPTGFAPLLTTAGDLRTLPHRDGMDGAYAARLVRGTD